MAADSVATAIVLVDPVSTGRLLKRYVVEAGHKLVGVFTLSEEELRCAGKHLPYDEKVEHCDVVVHSRDAAQILDELEQLPYRIVAVIPASEPGVELADALAHRLGLKGNAVATSAARRDKHEARKAICEAGLQGPAFAACRTREEATAFAREHGLPVVVKTPKGAGAHHVFICESLEEVASAASEVINGRNVFGGSTSFALIEGFISGPQYAIELFGDGETLHLTGVWALVFGKNAFDVIAFERLTTITESAALDSLRHLVDYALAVGRAVDVKWGPLLVELRDDPVRGPSLIEVGARLSGIDMPVLVRESSNFDPFAATIEAYATSGRFVLPPVRFSKTASLVFCPADGRGVVDEIRGLDPIERLASHVTTHLHVAPGDAIGTSSDLATIPLYVYLAHEDRAQLEDDVRAVRRLFGIAFRSAV